MSAATRVVVAAVLLVGVAGSLAALGERGGQEQLRLAQSRSLALAPATTLAAARVQEFVARAPEPVAAASRTAVRAVRCTPGGSDGPLRNPWRCQLRYRSGTQARYRVVVQPDGHYTGTGTGRIDGCCIQTPARG
jgi:hypothetical protein